MKGYPIRIEIGPRDIKNNSAIMVRRDTSDKEKISLDNFAETVVETLDKMQEDLFNKAKKFREDNTFEVESFEEYKAHVKEKKGFGKAMWCGSTECEAKLKEETGATIRCIPFQQEKTSEKCHFCDEKAKHMVYIAKAY